MNADGTVGEGVEDYAWSAGVKRRLLAHGDFVCRDLVAASEGGPFAVSETGRGDNAVTARFMLLPGARVIDDTGRDVVPGSGQICMLAHQLGFPLPAPAAQGMWVWERLHRECGFKSLT